MRQVQIPENLVIQLSKTFCETNYLAHPTQAELLVFTIPN